MPIAGTIIGSLAAKSLEKALDALNDLRKESRADKVSIDDSQARSCLMSHIQSVDAWSNVITLLSLLRDKQLRDSFVELSLEVGLIRYDDRSRSHATLTIDDIANATGHVVILGRPGAGKTTSLQRVA